MKAKLSKEQQTLLLRTIENDTLLTIILAAAQVTHDKDKRGNKLFYQLVDEFQKRLWKYLRTDKRAALSPAEKKAMRPIIYNDDVACELVLAYNLCNDTDPPHEHKEQFRTVFAPKIKAL